MGWMGLPKFVVPEVARLMAVDAATIDNICIVCIFPILYLVIMDQQVHVSRQASEAFPGTSLAMPVRDVYMPSTMTPSQKQIEAMRGGSKQIRANKSEHSKTKPNATNRA